jgi:hypothetical protein
LNREEIRRHLEKVRNSVESVLQHYCDDKGCPCDYSSFIYWAGKTQGPSWQDNVQNQLVKSALKLPCFEKTDKMDNKDWGYQGSWFCNNCGTLWDHISIEWRMLAFQERLLRTGEEKPDSLYPDLTSEDLAATVGHWPIGLKALSLEQWTEFMMGRGYRSKG